MNPITRDDLAALVVPRAGACASIFVPIDPTGRDRAGPTLMLKNLLNEAEQSLCERGIRAPRVREMLDGPRRLVDENLAGVAGSAALALLIDDEGARVYTLPFDVDAWSWVGDRFAVRPLVPVLDSNGRYMVLAVSQNRVALLRGSRAGLEPVDVSGLPRDLNDALNRQQPQNMLQFHTARSGGDMKQDAIFHGQGAAADEAKQDILAFFREIDRALHPYLRGDNLPLVFAGVDYLFPIYRQANNYARLMDRHVVGNPDRVAPAELHERAWPIVAPQVARAAIEALTAHGRLRGTAEASDEIPVILRAACQGGVATLLVSRGRTVWGTFDAATGACERHAQRQSTSEELVDRACFETIARRGAVYVVEPVQLAGCGAMGAVFRYPLPADAAAAGEVESLRR